jgi:hypothetical protein
MRPFLPLTLAKCLGTCQQCHAVGTVLPPVSVRVGVGLLRDRWTLATSA